jgi:RES domain-containing protein
MLVYRIALNKYANQLVASGRAARWNPNEVQMIYTSSSRSLACLENVVHRSQLGLNQLFSVMTIQIDDRILIDKIELKRLGVDWKDFDQMYITQAMGQTWIEAAKAAVLKVPSSIIEEESNYLINPRHTDFGSIKLIKTEPFVFDHRIKQL